MSINTDYRVPLNELDERLALEAGRLEAAYCYRDETDSRDVFWFKVYKTLNSGLSPSPYGVLYEAVLKSRPPLNTFVASTERPYWFFRVRLTPDE
jgi:hypothetical protein